MAAGSHHADQVANHIGGDARACEVLGWSRRVRERIDPDVPGRLLSVKGLPF